MWNIILPNLVCFILYVSVQFSYYNWNIYRILIKGVASTADVPLSAAGNAEIEETITLPAVCVAPIVLIRIRLVDVGGGPVDIETLGVPPPWIAASGF